MWGDKIPGLTELHVPLVTELKDGKVVYPTNKGKNVFFNKDNTLFIKLL